MLSFYIRFVSLQFHNGQNYAQIARNNSVIIPKAKKKGDCVIKGQKTKTKKIEKTFTVKVSFENKMIK